LQPCLALTTLCYLSTQFGGGFHPDLLRCLKLLHVHAEILLVPRELDAHGIKSFFGHFNGAPCCSLSL
jgi:hypothetical protein